MTLLAHYYEMTRTIPRKEGGNWVWGRKQGKWHLLGYRVAEGGDMQADIAPTMREVDDYHLTKEERKAANRAYTADAKRLAAMQNSAMAE